jgi:hypothetical protein
MKFLYASIDLRGGGGSGFWVQRFGVLGSGFWVLGSEVLGSAFGGSKVQGFNGSDFSEL